MEILKFKEFKKINEHWEDLLQNVYSSFEEFKSYNEIYNLAQRLGYETAEEAWEANPKIQGSTDPADYSVVKDVNIEENENYKIPPFLRGLKKLNEAELYRDMNNEMKSLLNKVMEKYKISHKEAAKAICEYYSTEHYNTDGDYI